LGPAADGEKPDQVTPETLACLAFFWILYVEVLGSLRRVDRAVESEYGRGLAYVAGVKFGAVVRCLSLMVSGLLALDGYRVAFVMFALLVVWGAISAGTRMALRFGAGFQAARGYFPSTLASIVGVVFVIVTRGLPLAAFSCALRRTWV
jgi:hypothetical protein